MSQESYTQLHAFCDEKADFKNFDQMREEDQP